MKITIPGEPQGKARARVTRFGTYTPEKTANYESLVKLIAKQTINEILWNDGQPLEMHLKAFYSIPKSTSKKKSEDMKRWIIRPIKKPDLDNVCKIIADALNGIVYKDDTQIVKIIAEKYYAETPCVEVSIKEAI